MSNRNIFILYITKNSGHHMAARSIERGIKKLDKTVNPMTVDSFRYTNPILERVITKTYLQVIKNTPDIWDYLYDNKGFKDKTEYIRNMVYKFNSEKLKKLIAFKKPELVICTQAFPCGTISDFKRTSGIDLPLVAVVTDFAAHSYWIHDNVDLYIVPTEEVKMSLIERGVYEERIKVLGIPISPYFNGNVSKQETREKLGLSADEPLVLVMGGGQGLGPIKKIVTELDKLDVPLQIAVVTGVNKLLYQNMIRRNNKTKKRVRVYGYVKNIYDLMHVSDILVTKPGGLTTSEALAVGLPMIIINPLPGQEMKNTDYLIRQNVALVASGKKHVSTLVNELLQDSEKLTKMKENAFRLSKPESSLDIAKEVLKYDAQLLHI
ncbi:MAG: glycosyltransferase [Candidatus Ancaeobacter aquaticus]|nr:glycosyltransferase [Candidatus Ancaeobacter aquaticus]